MSQADLPALPHALCFCLQSADSGKQPSTLAGQFKKSLDQLMKILTKCEPYFIRCIKPNEYKKPLVMREAVAHLQGGHTSWKSLVASRVTSLHQGGPGRF